MVPCADRSDPIRTDPTRPDRPTDRPTDPTRPDPTDRDFLTFVFDSVVEPHNCRAQPANRPCSVQLHRFQPPKGFTSTLLLAREKHPRLTPLSTPFPRARVSVNSSVFSPRRTSFVSSAISCFFYMLLRLEKYFASVSDSVSSSVDSEYSRVRRSTRTLEIFFRTRKEESR